MSTDDSQASRTFVKVLNKVLSAGLRCILCDAEMFWSSFNHHKHLIMKGALLMMKGREAIRQPGGLPAVTILLYGLWDLTVLLMNAQVQ